MRTLRRAAKACAVGVALCASPAQAQLQVYEDEDGNAISLSTQFQVQLRTSSCSSFPIEAGGSACTRDAPNWETFLRRARIVFRGTLNGWVDFKFQPDFSAIDRVTLLDAYAKLKFSSAARLTIGNMKRPFDGFQLTSSSQILTIERDLDIPGIPSLTAVSLDELTTDQRFADRDVGLMLDGGFGGFHYWVGMYNGSAGLNEDGGNGKQLVGRAMYSFDVGSLPLDLAVGGSLNDNDFENEDGSLGTNLSGSLELWGELGDFERGGLHLQTGVIIGKNTGETKDGEEPDFTQDPDLANLWGWQLIGGWKFLLGLKGIEGIQPILRITGADPNTSLDEDGGWALTPGVQLFFKGRNKLALNWDIVYPGSPDFRSEHSFKTQFQMYF